MAKTYNDEELKAKMTLPGWRVSRNKEAPIGGTLHNLLHLAHQRHKQGETPGVIQEIESKIELDMIQVEKLWRYLGLPV